jgi:pimeloyl-ACP methyl ester carboxylesterase
MWISFSRLEMMMTSAVLVLLLAFPHASAEGETEFQLFLKRPLIMDQESKWNQQVRARLDEINQRFYREARIAGTSAFTHGKKTKIAVLLVHGLFMNETFFSESVPAIFDQGFNVFNLTLPGHERGQRGSAESDFKKWSLYLEAMLELAHTQGEKVIVIGHSMGAGLALLASQKKLVDGLVLFQPALQVTHFAKGLALIGSEWRRFRAEDPRLQFMVGTAQTAFEFFKSIPDLSQIPLSVPTLLYSSNLDVIVSSAAQLKFAELNPTQIELVRHFQVHMYNPLSNPVDRTRVTNFIQSHFGS